MKIKIGPVEIEQDPIKDELFFEEFKKSPKTFDKYLSERSKVLDLAIKNLIAGKTVKTIRDAVFSIAGGLFFVGWSAYVFVVSKDAFVWEEMNLATVIGVILQALLIVGICFLPVFLIGGFIRLTDLFRTRKKVREHKQETEEPDK